MNSNEYPKEYGQQVVSNNIELVSSNHNAFLSAPQIDPSLTPPAELDISHNNDSSSTGDSLHCHACGYCGAVFACEMEHRGPEDVQQCDYCEVWSMSFSRNSNKQRLADYLDDQVVIEEVRAQTTQEKVSATLTGKGDNE